MSIEEEKHNLAVLVEVVLYRKVRSLNESSYLNKRQERANLINSFIKENRERFKSIPYDEYVKHINFILERTEDNVRKIREADDR